MVWCLRGVIINVVGRVVPAEAVDEDADREGSEHSSHREDGHRERPQSCQSGPRDGLWKPAAPRLVVEALDDLKHRTTHRRLSVDEEYTPVSRSALNQTEIFQQPQSCQHGCGLCGVLLLFQMKYPVSGYMLIQGVCGDLQSVSCPTSHPSTCGLW